VQNKRSSNNNRSIRSSNVRRMTSARLRKGEDGVNEATSAAGVGYGEDKLKGRGLREQKQKQR
jgi:hypothetical protein